MYKAEQRVSGQIGNKTYMIAVNNQDLTNDDYQQELGLDVRGLGMVGDRLEWVRVSWFGKTGRKWSSLILLLVIDHGVGQRGCRSMTRVADVS